MNVDRIATDHQVTAMVALDTFDLIVARVRNLLSHGRRMSMSERYTYTGDSPRLCAGLTVDLQARDGGLQEWADASGCGFQVALMGLNGFGFSVYTSDGNRTEAEAWKQFHAHKAESSNYLERRRNMTEVEITGGRARDEPNRDDRIVIRAWNSYGVCDERVIVFDGGAR